MPTWIITGANRGLGLEFVTQLSKDAQNNVIACVRSPSRGHPELDTLQNHNSKIHILECDTSSETSIKKFGSEVTKHLGENAQIDYLLNNAGINNTPSLDILTLSSDAMHSHITTNVLGPALTVQVLNQHLHSGCVVMNMTSGMGSLWFNKTLDPPFVTVYAISKAALNMLTVQQAGQLKARGIKVICMDPGWVKTDMGGADAMLEKEESIEGMLKVVKGLKSEDSGKFFVYDGSEKAW